MTDDDGAGDELGAFGGAEDGSAEEARGRVASEKAIVVFSLRGESYAIAARDVREIAPYREPTPMPDAPAALAGLAQYGGTIVAVLRDPLGRPAPAQPPACVLLCPIGESVLGVPADVVEFDPAFAHTTEL